MRHIIHPIILLAWAALAVLSCAKPPTYDEPSVLPSGDEDLVTVLFSASGGHATKLTGVTDAAETAIGRWALFAFDTETGWFRCESASGGSALPLQLRAGRTYTVYAVVNYPERGVGAFVPSSVRTPSDITETVAYLGDNAPGALLMYGSTTVTPQPVAYDPEAAEEPEPERKAISVRRLVSRVDLRGLAVDFSGKPALESKTFTLRRIYVTNAYRTTRYGTPYTYAELSSTRSAWYNSGGLHRGEGTEAGMDALLVDGPIGRVVTAGSPYTGSHSFYPFPNPTPASEDILTMDAWTRRCTRLVIEASIDSDIVYYAIRVPSMVRNRIYAASSVVIHGRGSNDPEIVDIDPEVITATVEPVIEDGWDGAGDVTLD